LEILASCTGKPPREVADGFTSYGSLKDAVADALIEELRPIRERTLALLDDPAELDRIRAKGAVHAKERGAYRLESALRMAGVG
jgi:tryptophanyl-tRNA synthetase